MKNPLLQYHCEKAMLWFVTEHEDKNLMISGLIKLLDQKDYCHVHKKANHRTPNCVAERW